MCVWQGGRQGALYQHSASWSLKEEVGRTQKGRNGRLALGKQSRSPAGSGWGGTRQVKVPGK